MPSLQGWARGKAVPTGCSQMRKHSQPSPDSSLLNKRVNYPLFSRFTFLQTSPVTCKYLCKGKWQGEILYGQGTAPWGPQALPILLRNASRNRVLEAPQPGGDAWFTLLAGKAFPGRALPFARRHACCHLIQQRAGTQSCRRRGLWCSSKPTLETWGPWGLLP